MKKAFDAKANNFSFEKREHDVFFKHGSTEKRVLSVETASRTYSIDIEHAHQTGNPWLKYEGSKAELRAKTPSICLMGSVYGHPEKPRGSSILTSPVTKVLFSDGTEFTTGFEARRAEHKKSQPAPTIG